MRGVRLAIFFAFTSILFGSPPVRSVRAADASADPAPPAREVLQVSFDAGAPSLRTTLGSTGADGEANAFHVRELAEPISATVVEGSDAAGKWVVPTSIALRSITRDADATVWTDLSWRRTALGVGPSPSTPTWMLDLQQTVQGTGRLRFTRLVRLRAWRDPAAPGTSGLFRFVVSDPGALGQAGTHLNLTTFSFEQLRREAPRECDRYLRPMFAAFGQQAVFAPDPLVAFQVFSARKPAPPGSGEAVADLLPALASSDYRARERATRRLAALGRDGALAMLQLNRGGLSIEQNHRVDQALSDYLPLSPAEADRLRDDADFLLDALYSDEPPVRQSAYDRLKLVAPPVAAIDPLEPPSLAEIEAWRQRLRGSGQ